MQHQMQFQLDTLIDEVMRRNPATIKVLIDENMHCIGCPLAGFHSVADAALEHDKEPTKFLEALNNAR
ncbi:MAG: DUF1858 domain-containing protein [Rhizobiaceae bacterium]